MPRRKKDAAVHFGGVASEEEVSVNFTVDKLEEEIAAARTAIEKRKSISAKNRQTRANGRLFEEMILRSCRSYRRAGLATIKKVPEARRVVGRTGGRKSLMICANEAKADPDFMGSVSPDGRCMVFDAKHTDKDRILATALTDNQVRILESHEACGALCMVAVSFGFERFFMIPYSVWRDMKAVFGRKYIMPGDEAVQDYLVPFQELGVDKKKRPIIAVWFLGEAVPVVEEEEEEAPDEGDEDDLMFD